MWLTILLLWKKVTPEVNKADILKTLFFTLGYSEDLVVRRSHRLHLLGPWTWPTLRTQGVVTAGWSDVWVLQRGPCHEPGELGAEKRRNLGIPEFLQPASSHFISQSCLCNCLKQKLSLCLSTSLTYLHSTTKLISTAWFYRSSLPRHLDPLAACFPGGSRATSLPALRCAPHFPCLSYLSLYCWSLLLCLIVPTLPILPQFKAHLQATRLQRPVRSLAHRGLSTGLTSIGHSAFGQASVPAVEGCVVWFLRYSDFCICSFIFQLGFKFIEDRAQLRLCLYSAFDLGQ